MRIVVRWPLGYQRHSAEADFIDEVIRHTLKDLQASAGPDAVADQLVVREVVQRAGPLGLFPFIGNGLQGIVDEYIELMFDAQE